MARPRSFDEDEVVQAAMLTFWEKGYDEAPVSLLENSTGLKRVSLYNAFGDKEGLFVAALARYHSNALEIYENGIARGGLTEIKALFASMSAPADAGSPAHWGCLMVNTILDVRRSPPAVRSKTAGYKALIYEAFKSALENARTEGALLCSDQDVEERATYLVGLLWGALCLIRAEGQTTAALPVAKVGSDIIDSWRA